MFSGDAGNVVTLSSAGTVGDWLCMEYRGYGFQLEMLTGPAFGQVQVYLDGALMDFIDDEGNDLGTTVDLYSSDAAAPTIVRTKADVPLDLHRVKGSGAWHTERILHGRSSHLHASAGDAMR